MPLVESTIRSSLLGNERRAWFQRPTANRSAQALCVLLDGEYYVDRMNAPVHQPVGSSAPRLPPLAIAYISHIDGPTRWKESFCDEPFSRFVAEELLPWVRGQFRPHSDHLATILGGLSLTGLAAAHTGLRYPDSFSGILCQSASFWWSESWIVNECRKQIWRPPCFSISCGTLETTDYVEHGPELPRCAPQLASNRAMQDALQRQGATVCYEEFDGGHDLDCWREDLPRSLAALLAKVAEGARSRP